MREPYIETQARLGWFSRHGEIIFDPDQPYVTYSLTPVFPYCSGKLAELGIVWDLWRLLDSVRRPGAYFILNSECGYPPDAYLEVSVLVSHPDSETVIWEIDIEGLRPALDTAFDGQDGFIRLVFRRDEYEADIRAMLREVQHAGRTLVPLERLRATHGYDHLVQHHPDIRALPVGVFEPTVHGDCDLDEFAALDAEAAWPREPIYPPGTSIEIGFFGTELYRIDGQTHHDWLGRWFTRWQVLDAFRQWMDHATKWFALRFVFRGTDVLVPVGADPNAYVLLPDRDVESCHRGGEAFAAAFQRGLEEGMTAPGVSVRYLRLDLPQACLKSAAAS